MKIDFFIFRHGETEWNRLRKIQGHSDIPLNEHGRNQAKELGKTLSNYDFDYLYSSDLLRAVETIGLALPSYKEKIIKTESLREAYLGVAEGKTIEDINREYGEDFWLSFVSQGPNDTHKRFPEGESVGETNQRILNFVDLIVENYSKEERDMKIVLSTHGAVIRNILGHLFPLADGMSYDIPNCVTYKITYDIRNSLWAFGGRVSS